MSVSNARLAGHLVAAIAVAGMLGGCGREAEMETERAGITPAEALPAATQAAIAPEVAAELEEKWGVRIDSLRRSVAGYALDFRYWVVDPEKAKTLLQRKLSHDPHVIVEKSGAILRVPRSSKIGSIRQSVRVASQIKEGKRYFVLFANPARHVVAGDKVTIVIGDFRVENITVL